MTSFGMTLLSGICAPILAAAIRLPPARRTRRIQRRASSRPPRRCAGSSTIHCENPMALGISRPRSLSCCASCSRPPGCLSTASSSAIHGSMPCQPALATRDAKTGRDKPRPRMVEVFIQTFIEIRRSIPRAFCGQSCRLLQRHP